MTTATAGTGDLLQRGVKRLGRSRAACPRADRWTQAGSFHHRCEVLPGRQGPRQVRACSLDRRGNGCRSRFDLPWEARDGRRRERPWVPPPGVARLNRARADGRMFCQPSRAPGRHLVGPSAATAAPAGGPISGAASKLRSAVSPRADQHPLAFRRLGLSRCSYCLRLRLRRGRTRLPLLGLLRPRKLLPGGVPDPNASAVLR
jgi:hypothetical protein